MTKRKENKNKAEWGVTIINFGNFAAEVKISTRNH